MEEMGNEEALALLKRDISAWNEWRHRYHLVPMAPSVMPMDLSGVNLEGLHLKGAELGNANLTGANFAHAQLQGASFAGSNLEGANLYEANLEHASLRGARLVGANLTNANLEHIRGLNAFFRDAKLSGANLSYAELWDSYLNGVDLTGVNLHSANLFQAHLREANLTGAVLREANLAEADLRGANLTRTDLTRATLIGTNIDDAVLSESLIYAVNVWDLKGEFREQKDLVISGESKRISRRETGVTITVDNIKFAQFVYLLLSNEELRDVINTLTSRSVLILGRFTILERKQILEGLRNKLREYNLLPIVFDFDRPTDKDFTETIKTLAGLSYFVIADVSNPKSSPLELQATVPDYQIPFVPIIQEGESPFAMMVDLQKKYDWVLNTVSYDSEETLMKVLKPLIIDPAMKKRQELRVIKAREPEIISAREFLAKGGS